MYAETITRSMQAAIDTTNERRERQMAYNEAHGIEPKSIRKLVRDLTDDISAHYKEDMAVAEGKASYTTTADLPKAELHKMITELEKQMKTAAQALEFEKAAQLRDQIVELRQIMVLKESGADGDDIPEWERLRRLDEAGVSYDIE